MIELPDMPDLNKFGGTSIDIATNHPEGTAEKNFEEAVTIGKQLLQEGEDTKAAYDALNAGVRQRSAQLVLLRKEQEDEAAPAFTDVLSNADLDAGRYAKAYAARAQLISFTASAIEYGREHLLPTALLTMLDAQWRMAKAGATIADWNAIVAGVARYKASQALLETDGAVVFTATGRAFELFQQAQEAHRRAYRAYEALVFEQNRQNDRNKLKGLL